MGPISKFASAALAALALITLAACATQSEAPPPEPEPEPATPTMDIWTAAGEGNLAELEANKHAGADLDGPSADFQVTPLTIAVVADQADAALWLLDNGANVNGLNGDGSTALNAAAFLGRAEVAKLLIDGGVDTSIRNYEGQSAVDLARIDWQTTEYYAAMLQLDVDRATVEAGRKAILGWIEGRSDAGSTGVSWEELAFAIVAADTAAVKAALAAGTDANMRDPNTGGTPLILAAFLGQPEVATMLLMAGADIHAMNNDGANALQVAELDWETTEYIAALFQIPITDAEAWKRGKAEVAEMLRAKM